MVNGGRYEIPLRIGRYEVIAELGRGGMGVVYHAYEPTLDRSVALKILSPALADEPGFVERLRREAVSAARLRHPHIALLYEFGQSDGFPFLTMEYIDGPSLRQMLEAGPLAPERVLRIVEQIAGALEYAHAMGIVHRDVKPSNILVGPNDHAVLIDFGLAQMAEDPLLTGDYALLGTPHYMAPEQARGDGVDARSDQYALAAVVYEMLTGVPLFHGRSAAAVLHGHIYEPPPVATERCPSLPETISTALLRALAKSPAARYPSLQEFIVHLRAAFATPVEPQRRRASWWVISGMIALVSIIILAMIGFQSRGSATNTSQRILSTNFGVPIPAKVAWLYDPGFAGGSAPVIAGGSIIFGTLDGSIVALAADDGRVRWKKDSGSNLFGMPGAGAGQIFVGNAEGDVFCLDPTSGMVVWRQRVSGAVQRAPLRNNARLIVTTAQGYVYVLQVGTGAILWSHRVSEGIGAPTVGAGNVFVSAGHSLFALDGNSGVRNWQFQAESTITTQSVVAGNMVLLGTERGLLYGLDTDNGQEQLRYQAHGPISAAPVVGVDAIYLADHSGELTAISSDDKQDIWHFKTNTAITATPLLADGKLFFGTSGGNVYSLDARSGRQLAAVQLEGSISTTPVPGSDFIYARAKYIYALSS